jgi:hypothetical protein
LTLPEYLHSLDDLYSLIRTSRGFYDCFAGSTAKLRPSFAKRDGQRLFPPHPHLLIAGCARSVADWAIESHENEAQLQKALESGIDGLFDFCTREGRMSLGDVRALTRAKYDLLNPISRQVDDSIGPAAREARYTASGRTLDDDAGEWWTIMEYPDLSLLNHWIYCELFHHAVDAAIDILSVRKRLSWKTRVTFMSYCIPDCNNKIIQVSYGIFEQLYGCAHSPWDTVAEGRLRCFMMIQELLYKEDGSPFCRKAVGRLLAAEGLVKKPQEDARELSWGYSTRPYSSADDLLLNTILHKPLLCFRLLLPGGLEATRAEIEDLKQKCGNDVVAKRWSDIRDLEEDAVSNGEGDEAREEGNWGRKSWRWESMPHDCKKIIWTY